MDDLLRSCSWHAEKLFRRRGHFASVLWLSETTTGHRQLFETGCQAPESVTATDQELLEALAEEMHEDFAILGITRFAVAYLGTRVTVIRSLDPNSTMQPKTTRVKGVVIELHGVAEPVRLFRQIIKPPSGQPVLAAAVTLDPPVDSPYADVLARPTTASCANDAEAPVH